MSGAKSVRIDPNVIKMTASKPPAPVSAGRAKASFGDFLGIAGAFAPLAGEAGYQLTGNANAATVLHSAFSALPAAYGSSQGYMGSMAGDLPGVMGSAKYSTPLDAYGIGAGDATGAGGSALDQASLINQMNENNMNLLELQALMQNNMQQWTTRSNVLKSVHDAKMAMIQHFAVRG